MIICTFRLPVPHLFSLEIIQRFQMIQNRYGLINIGLYVLLIGRRCLVTRPRFHRGGINPFHRLAEFLHGNGFKGCITGHHPAGSMRCRLVPIRISLPLAKQGTVAHIQGNQQHFPGLCGYSPLRMTPSALM